MFKTFLSRFVKFKKKEGKVNPYLREIITCPAGSISVELTSSLLKRIPKEEWDKVYIVNVEEQKRKLNELIRNRINKNK